MSEKLLWSFTKTLKRIQKEWQYLKKYLKGLQSKGKSQFGHFFLHAWGMGVSLCSMGWRLTLSIFSLAFLHCIDYTEAVASNPVTATSAQKEQAPAPDTATVPCHNLWISENLLQSADACC